MGAGLAVPWAVLIPLGTDRPLRRTPWVTYALLVLNVVAYLAQVIATRNLPGPVGGPVDLFVLDPGNSGWWTWGTYAFLHGGGMHLLGNMVFFWVFAQAVEDRLGHVGFAAFYLIGAVATALAHAVFKDARVVGASGAVACCTGAYLVMFPMAGVRVLLFFILIGIFVLPAWVFIALAIARDIAMFGLGVSGIAVEAHLAGYLYGGVVAYVLLATGLLPREPYDLFTFFNQRRRRGQIRGAVRGSRMDRPMAAERKRGPKREKPSPEAAAATLREGIEKALADRRPGSAATMYRRLTEEHGPALARLPRDVQLDLANSLYQKSHYELAARAYEAFVEFESEDAEAPMVRVLLARILAEHLGEPTRARELLRAAIDELEDPALREVAQRDLEGLAQEGGA